MKHLLLAAALAWLGLAAPASPGPADEAAYIGKYSLADGGGDAMSGVHLLLLKGGDYVLAYFGGLQHGSWQLRPDGRLNLTEWTGDPTDFAVYGRYNPALGKQANVQFRGFEESYAKVGWLPPGKGQVSLHPVFAPDAQLGSSRYRISRPAAELAVLYLAAYQSAAELGATPVPFAKELLYTFPLPKGYNDYQLLYRAEASKPAEKYIGQLQNGELTLYNNSADPQQRGRPSKFGARQPLSALDLREMKELLAEVRQPLPAHYTPEVAGEAPVTYARVAGTSAALQARNVQLLKPLFGAESDK